MPETSRKCRFCGAELEAGASRCAGCEQEVRAPAGRPRRGGAQALTFCTVVVVMAFWTFGFFAQLMGGIFVERDPRFGLWMLVGGGGLMALALTLVARMKGRSWAWGLFGFASFPALFAVLLLGRRCYRCGASPRGGAECPRCGDLL